MADLATDGPSPAIDFDVDGAREAGYTDAAIASYLATKTNFDLGAAKKAGYNDNAVIGFLAKQPARPEPPPPSSGTVMADVKGVASGLINSVGSIFGGAGDILKSGGNDLKKEAQQEDERRATVLSAFDYLDSGNQLPRNVKDNQGNTLNPHIFADYKAATPEERAAIRAKFQAQSPAVGGIEDTIGTGIHHIGEGDALIGDKLHGAADNMLTDEEKSRTSVKISSMVGGIVPLVGAALAGDLPALIGVGGIQGFGDHYDAAIKAGKSEDQAATAGMLGGMVQGGLMAVPVHKAMEVMDALPAVARSSVLKAIVEVAKSSGTMIGFSELSKLANNAIAKSTYDPTRSMTEGVGDDLVAEGAAGAILPIAGAGIHLATKAAGALVKPKIVDPVAPTPEAEKTASTANDIMAAGDLDEAIGKASAASSDATGGPTLDKVQTGSVQLDDARPNPQLDKLQKLFSGLNEGHVEKIDDESYNYHTKDSEGRDIAVPLRVWDPESAPVSDTTISPDIAEAQRQYYTGEHGIDVVYFEGGKNIPFDGVVDPEQPNTLFLSNDPTRNAVQVAAHEFTHVLEDTKTPDGESLGDILHQQVLAGITDTGWDYAKSLFGSTAPDRAHFDEGDAGDAQHAQAVTRHLITELAGDLGGEAPKFDTFIPRVIDQVEKRYGATTAKEMFRQFLDGIRNAMETLRKFFVDGRNTVSQHLVSNLDDVHETLAKMYAAKYGDLLDHEEPAPSEESNARKARLAAMGVREIPPEFKFSPRQEFEQEEWHPDGPTFFSTLARGVEDTKMDKASPGQWLATIKNMPGIKSEERALSGVEEWLGAQAKPVTKAELLQHLNDNDVKLQESIKDGDDEPTKFENYVLPGGENYKEMLLALPPKHGPAWDAWQAKISDLKSKYGDNFYNSGKMTSAEKNDLNALHRAAGNGAGDPASNFKSTHFDEPNILAHTRFDDRIGPDGKRTLHLAEIQSDWHQAGRRDGYAADSATVQKLTQEAEAARQKLIAIRDSNVIKASDGRHTTFEDLRDNADKETFIKYHNLQNSDEYRNAMTARNEIDVKLQAARKGVPDAPFKTTWHELAMKRMLRYAAENGYDRISWDTGETQADRYDIGNSVDKIEWTAVGDKKLVIIHAKENVFSGPIELGVDQNGVVGKPPIQENGAAYKEYEGKKLADVIGKEMSEKILGNRTGDLEGQGLKIGAEGMKGFYDKILPNFVNKYVKKWGAKVENSTVPAPESTLSDRYAVEQNRSGEYEIRDSRTDEVVKTFGMPGLANKEARRLNGSEAKEKTAPVHSVTITPEMRASVMRGQPKFSPRVKTEEKEGVKVPKEVAVASGYANSEAIASSRRWQTGRDLKVAMQEAVKRLAAKAGVDLTDKSAQTTKHLIASVKADVMHALKANAGAIGWYDLKTRQALRVAALVHPEIATDPNTRFAFVYALAASSNGVKVDKNFDYAEQIYNHYKASDEMPTHLKFGLAQESINKTLELFNILSKKWGLEKFRKFMLTEYAMKEITALTGVKPAGEHADTIGRGAAIMGPKIGNGFFSNLYGHFDALTMDRWLIRTWGRHTGTLIVEQPRLVETSRARVGDALRALDPKDYDKVAEIIGHPIAPNMNFVDDLAAAVKDSSTDPERRSQLASSPAGDELRKASINLVKYLDGQKEAPDGPHERVFIRKVFQAALADVRQDPRYADITMADMQAVLWYAEKRLYEHAKTDVDLEETGGVRGYEEEAEAPDYANAAVGMVKNTNERVLSDPALTDVEKRDRLISDRRINAALAKEEKSGRAIEAQSGPEAGTGEGGRRRDAGGFTDREKRAFAGAVAAQDVRSARLGDDPASFSFERKGSGDGRGIRVLKSLGVSYVAEWKAGAGLRRVYLKNGNRIPDKILELAPGDEKSAERFHQAISEAKKANKSGAAVAVYPVEDYKTFRLLLSDDGKSGAAVKPDGDIISVFATNGSGHAIFEAAIAAGGRKLDAFDTILPDFYHSHGFVEAGRVAWDDSQSPEGWDRARFAEFNGGRPDVVLMVLDRNEISPILAKAKVYKTWDEAARAQEKLLKKMDREQPAAVVNLRLDRLDGQKPFKLADAVAELQKFGVDVVASRTRKVEGKPGEPGVVLHLSRPLSAEEAKEFSEAMKQEAIPQFANGRGELHGPEAKKWGAFSAEKFHPLVEGTPLYSPRLNDEVRERLAKLHPDLAAIFGKIPEKPAEEPGFKTNPAKIAAEHEAEVSSLEAQGAAKAAPKAEPSAKPAAPAEPKQRTLVTQHPEGKGRKIERALNEEETRALENEPQEIQARKLVDKNPDRALRIAMREEQPPKNLLPTFVYFELERRATAAGNEDMIEKLRQSPLAKEVTTAARTVQSFVTRDPQSAVAKIQEVEQAREASVAKRADSPVETIKATEVANAVPKIRKAVKEQIKARPVSDWAAFIDTIRCK